MKKLIRAVLFVIVGFAGAGMVTAASVNLSWTPPTTRVDGSPLLTSELSGYELSLNGAIIANPVAGVTSFTYNIAKGSCAKAGDSFVMRVKDTAGLWSAMSTPASLGVDACSPKSEPSAPTLKVSVGP